VDTSKKKDAKPKPDETDTSKSNHADDLESIIPGTEAGDQAAEYWADRVVSTTFVEDPGARLGLAFAVLWTPDTAWQTALTLGGEGAVAAGVRWGGEIVLGSRVRIAPFGNRSGHELGELSHYHRRGVDRVTGETLPGQGIGRHRPWEEKSTDKSFWDRF
jgi:hypothetical protein